MLSLAALLLIQLPGNPPWVAAEDGLSAWAPAAHVGAQVEFQTPESV